MLLVKLLLQGARTVAFQMPCRLAGCVPGRELARALDRKAIALRHDLAVDGRDIDKAGERHPPARRIVVDDGVGHIAVVRLADQRRLAGQA